jgi:Lipase (class 3)
MADTFSPFLVGSGVPNPDAVYEQIAGMVCVYSGAQANAVSLLGLCGGGTIVAWMYDPQGLLPSLAVLQQGSAWYAWIAGTVNVKQWVGNVTGALSYSNLGGGAIVHGFFYRLAQSLWAKAQPILPAQSSSLTFNVVGHSLGGAVAQILGSFLTKEYSPQQVNVLTFGQPKAYGGSAGSLNDFGSYTRLRIQGDPVPMTPFNAGETWMVGLSSGFWVGSQLASWMHYGDPFLLNQDGSITADLDLSYWQYVPFQWLTNVNTDNHLVKTYVSLLETGLGV